MNIKKLVLLAGLLFFLPLSAGAKDIIPDKIFAVAPTTITENTIEETQEITLYALDDYSIFDDALKIKKGEELVFILDKYNPAMRGKRNGAYSVTLKSPLPEDGDYVLSGMMFVAQQSDLKSWANKIGITVTGKALKIPGFSQAVAAAKGIIKPDEEKGRFRTVSRNVFESTPLKYVEKGKEFEVETDGIVKIFLRNTIN